MKNKILKSILYILADITIIYGVVLLSFLALSDGEQLKSAFIFGAGLSLLSILLLFAFNSYKTLTENFGIGDCLGVAISVGIANIVGLAVLLFVKPLPFKPIHVFIWAFGVISILFLMIFIRIIPRLRRIIKHHFKRSVQARTMIVGAGSAAKILIDDSRVNDFSHNHVVVIADDDISKRNKLFSNIPVEGPISNIKDLIKKYDVEEVIIAIASLSEDRLREILNYLKDSNVRIRRMPLLSEMNGPNDIKVVDININELLNRDPIKLDNTEVNEMLTGKTVLVTGGGGSIGSELMRQIFKTHPKKLIVFDIYENCTYDIQQELVRKMRNEHIKDIELIALIGSTYNETRVEQIIKKYKPDYIYHAAAYKHVPLMEDSPAEAIRTNVIGTYNVAKLADKYKVKKMVLVSTDKAVRPTNTMGATKRFAETIIQYFSEKSKNTAYAAVRFGNVLGSNGSVVPLFKKQIEEGGPITLTHKDIIRYFMTIPEAVSLILQCGLYAEGGEIFILDMGKPVKIYDLAVKLIRQAGLVPEKDIKIVETGLRPGEKLFEELLLDKSVQKKTANERIYIEEPEAIKPIEEEIKTISKVFDMEEKNDVKSLLASIIDTYKITDNK